MSDMEGGTPTTRIGSRTGDPDPAGHTPTKARDPAGREVSLAESWDRVTPSRCSR
jgi:hypothetical protein